MWSILQCTRAVKDSGDTLIKMLEYKVVEVSTVTDEELEAAINEKTREGWNLDGINFAMSQASKRPAMAFILFTRKVQE
jgi:hypothetical protein